VELVVEVTVVEEEQVGLELLMVIQQEEAQAPKQI